jgi:ABC-type branched-subunit amino acid transport system substrate-binding protein
VRTRGVALLLLMVLLSAACGARLTDEQREIALQGYSGGGGGGGDGGTDPGDPSDPTDPTSPGATAGPGGGGGGGNGGGGGGDGGAGTCEGDGSSPDKGVTGDQIKIAVVVDESGVQTGLFTPARFAMQAWAAYVNNAGGICGRQVVIDRYDTGTSGGGNLRATRQACNADFAIVGSMSAFDGGGYDAGNECQIPAIPAISTNAWKNDEIYPPNYYPAYPQRPDHIMDTAAYVNQAKPDVKSGAAAIWLNQPVARTNMGARIKAYEQAGFDFVYRQEAQVTDPNYASYVSQMKNHSPPVKYVTFVGNYQSAENLLQAMDQQSWHPDFIDFDSVVYSPLFLKDLQDRGITTTNLFWFINSTMFEEASSSEEMQLYTEWLQRVGGGAPDFFGLYAWSAGRLFEDVATRVGPKLTRKAFLAEIAKVKQWDSHGLHGPHQTGQKLTGPCYLYGDIQDYKFHRLSPASGWTCNRPTRTVPYPSSPN